MDDLFSPSSPTTDGGFPEDTSSPAKVDFAPPLFFPKGDYENDTGLENLFGRVFSLKDQPSVEEEEQKEDAVPALREGGQGLEQVVRNVGQRHQGRQREKKKSLLRAEVVLPVVMVALGAQAWWFDVTKWGKWFGE